MSPPSPFAMAQWRRVSMLPLLLWCCLSAAFIGPVARRSTLLGLFSATQQAAQALPGSPRLAGKYDDPEFPGCPREIVPQGARVLVRGTDGEGPSCQGKSWEAVGRRGRGNFFEHGPVALNSQGQLLPRAANETWATYAPVLYVDSPVGTGWSWARDQGFAKSQSDVARALARFLDIFAARHTGSRRLVLAGESYGGHYVPSLGNYLLQNPGPFQLEAVMVGDGLTDPAIQVLTKPQEAYAFGLVDETKLKEAQSLAQEAHALAQEAHWVEAAEKRSAMEDVVKNASEINPYDVRTTEQYDWLQERMQKFFEKKSNKDLLHIPENLTFGTSPQVKENLKADIMKSQKPHVESLLNAGVRVLLYQGQFDWKDGFVSNEAWIRTLSWEGTQQFLSSSRQLWRRTDQQLAGYWKSYENLEQVLVLGAGHLVPMNQPLSAVDLLLCFLKLEGRMTPTATPD